MKKKKARRDRMRPVKYDHCGFWRRLLEMMLWAVITALVVEGFNQGSVPRMLDYLRSRTLYFGVNCLVILACLSLSELFKHRKATIVAISSLWMVLGIANYMVVRHRTLPIAGGDLLLDYESVKLGLVYFSWVQIIGVFLGAVAVISAVAWVFSHLARRRRVNYAFSLCIIAMMVLLVFSANMMCIKAGLMPESFTDRVNSYKDYGFTSCFAFTFGRQGIDKPDEYSTETVDEILTEVDQVETLPQNTAAPQPTAAVQQERFTAEQMANPNIVFLQLESFFDIDTLLDTDLSGDPIPNFHALVREYPSGILSVPTIGGGTANVEFEVMSGFNMDFFGAGETPYNTIINEVGCETIATLLREHGYASTALHNNTGTFFNRSQVYANLGFDRFDSLEYMLYPKYNAVGWAHDRVLVDEILRAMDTTDAQDLIFAIGVESHGKYAETYTYQDGDIQVLSAPQEIYFASFQNYVNIIRPVDAFLGEILAAFEEYDEPVVAVIYGDHLPGLGLTREMLADGDLYASRYVIWNNYGAEFEAPDMQAYRLSAELLRQLGISSGVITKFHQAYPVDESGEEYLEKLQILEYDMLYGDQETFGEAGAPQPTQLQMGIDPVDLHSAEMEYDRLMITGENFTEYSVAAVGDKLLNTVFIDHEHIAVSAKDLAQIEDVQLVSVAQVNADGVELSRTEEISVQYRNISKDKK